MLCNQHRGSSDLLKLFYRHTFGLHIDASLPLKSFQDRDIKNFLEVRGSGEDISCYLTWKTLSTPAAGAVGNVRSFLTSRSLFFFSMLPKLSDSGLELLFLFFRAGFDGRESIRAGGGGIAEISDESSSRTSRVVSIDSSSKICCGNDDFATPMPTSTSTSPTMMDECQLDGVEGCGCSVCKTQSIETLLVRLSPRKK